jgi:hypothetical protein
MQVCSAIYGPSNERFPGTEDMNIFNILPCDRGTCRNVGVLFPKDGGQSSVNVRKKILTTVTVPGGETSGSRHSFSGTERFVRDGTVR